MRRCHGLALLALALTACGSVPRVPVQERSPTPPRELSQPVMPGSTAQAPAGAPRGSERMPAPPKPPAVSSIAGMTPPQSTADEPVAITTPLHADGEHLAQAHPLPGSPAARPAVPAGTSTLPALDWGWPVDTPMVAGYSETSHGVDFSGAMGQPVRAAAAGVVTFVGNSLRGYGWMVVVKHDKGYLSVYAHNRQVLVKLDQRVERGQRIAEMGNSDSKDVLLHFEVRRQGRAVDPQLLLPAR